MPHQHQPPSLRKASIENIVDHFDDFWYAWRTRDLLEQCEQPDVFTPFRFFCCAGSTRGLLEQSEQSDVFTPFQYLCDDMIQEIIETLDKRKLLRPDHFKFLLHSNIRRLNVRVVFNFLNDQNGVIQTLSTRCQKLTHLKLGRQYDVKPQLLCKVVRNLPQIVCLQVIGADASVIKAICGNCPNLLELGLNCSDYKSVNDTDLLYLCNYPENPKTRPKLKKLLIGRLNSPSVDTVVHLLKSQTSLQCLDTGYALIDHAFDQMYGEEFRSIKKVPSERVYQLLDITINGLYGKNINLGEAGRLDLTFQCCPFLTKLTLYNLKEDESLNNVAKLKHLQTLRVSMFSGCYFSMYMTPLLSEIGDNLTYLSCSRFDEVSLIIIGKLCPNLESLELRDVSLISEQHPIDGDVTQSFPYFTNLKVISIHLLDNVLLTENELSLLLQNATKIVRCEFKNVTNLTDRVISEANRKHGFRHLSSCYFSSCSHMSVKSLWVLLCSDNPLKHLAVSCCKYMTQQDINLLKNEAKLRQYNINIYYWNGN